MAASPDREYVDRRAPWRVSLGNVIFNNDTRAGQLFDLALTLLIFASVFAVMLESVSGLRRSYGVMLRDLEWLFTIVFTVEYTLRLVTARRALHYSRSFFGVVDLLSILPGFIALLFPGTQAFTVVRALRLLRVFRILRLGRYLQEASVITEALRASSAKITVFLATVLTLVLIIGALMYVVEGPENGYTSIPTSMYWAIVTITTVGYGDIAPSTPLGKFLASLTMILGYGILAVPTGIVTVSLARAGRPTRFVTCERCGEERHDTDARYCKTCGERLPAAPQA
ncbi:ion transporter [Deinococcus yavapaiensis]|uniref:Voltage-gated potassium channel n=1 Tax=Deinococcus yavapaiensis KR-236 TaxID=694435 RepID=A0A318SDE3_9DEIO|nr:ion transporter [Deinococcus yavapaiensis]PYE56663.1 voltage-gated potassium channel [Deinococcus yavapaiensis KR-236]